jgi:four helix bundle protein
MHLEQRTKAFALSIIRLYQSLAPSTVSQVLGKQILRSGTSVGAQYREAKRARSKAEFAAKIDSATQEMDETLYWLELILEAKISPPQTIAPLHTEANEIISMLVLLHER